jgi:acetyl-CoA synthetase
MNYPIIEKAGHFKIPPNLPDYETAINNFNWDAVTNELDWLPNGGLNIAYEAIDRHCVSGLGNKIAMVWIGKDDSEERFTFEELRQATNQFANVLINLGVKKGQRVFAFMERLPELYIAVFGTLKAGCITGPLFSAFGSDPVKDRLFDSSATLLITQPGLYRRIEHVLDQLPELKHVVIVDKVGDSNQAGTVAPNSGLAESIQSQDTQGTVPGAPLNYYTLMDGASKEFGPLDTTRDDFSVMHYTSGTTGKPKGAVHRHNAVIQHYLTGKWVLDLHPEDVYWCTADPGWVTGTSYGMFAPWTNGVTQVIYEGGFNPRKWYEIIQKHRVTVWYTAPTAIRMLMKAGTSIPQQFDLSSLRHINSVGEPLNPEAISWGQEAFNLPFHDNWWQTETGAIMIANFPSLPIRPGSMGKPLPGITAATIDKEGRELPPLVEGDLAIRPGWPSMFQTYWKNETQYNSKFVNGWYVTGDRARRDVDGYFWFVGRDDDVINTAGHLVGPFEVESALIEHPAVAEAGVIGKPDPVAMEIVKAFVSLQDGYSPSDSLRREILGFVREKLSSAVAPREIDFIDSLPKTRSGKIMRRLLKARELGLPEGDTSTLEDD